MGTLTKNKKVPRELARLVAQVSKEDPGFGGRLNRRLQDALAERDALADEGGGGADLALAAELGDLLFDLYSHRECFLRHAESLSVQAAGHTDWVVENTGRMLLSFARGQVEKARGDIDRGHRWYTGLKDSTETAGRWLGWFGVTVGRTVGETVGEAVAKKSLAITKPEAVSNPVPEAGGFFQQVVARHINEEVFAVFSARLEDELTSALALRWSESVQGVSSKLCASMTCASVRSSFAAASPVATGLDDGSKMALFGLGGAVASTAVLAAGWHTLAWSMGGLFLPLLPVVAVATVGVAFLRGGSERKKMHACLDLYRQDLERLLEDSVKYRMRSELIEKNNEIARELRELIFRHHVGSFSPGSLDRIIRTLEDWLDDLGHADGEDRGGSRKAAGVDWTARARHFLAEGAELPAAMYGALAFEQLLRGLNRELKLGFDFRVAHHNRAFIELVEQREALPADGISRLRDLKRRRDTFTHRMHFFATVPEARRRKSVARFLDDLEAAGRN